MNRRTFLKNLAATSVILVAAPVAGREGEVVFDVKKPEIRKMELIAEGMKEQDNLKFVWVKSSELELQEKFRQQKEQEIFKCFFNYDKI